MKRSKVSQFDVTCPHVISVVMNVHSSHRNIILLFNTSTRVDVAPNASLLREILAPDVSVRLPMQIGLNKIALDVST